MDCLVIKIWCLLVVFLDFVHNESTCRFPNGNLGVCLRLEQCEYVISLILQDIEPTLCGFINEEPLFCCEFKGHGQFKRRRGDLAEEYCHTHTLDSYTPNEISYGNNAAPRRYIHMAALGYGEEYEMLWLCGGSLISESFVLTAAHCLYSRTHGYIRRVKLGDLDLSTNSDDADPQTFSIRRAIRHPENNPPSSYNDIALLELEGFVRYSLHVGPACLHLGDEIEDNVIATGWGLVDNNDHRKYHLQEVFLEFASYEECSRIYGPSRKLRYGIIDTQICAGGGRDMRDTCMGDSGGPLQIQHTGRNGKSGYTVFAITSFGKLCGAVNSPSVYTLVYPYLSWIESIVWLK